MHSIFARPSSLFNRLGLLLTGIFLAPSFAMAGKFSAIRSEVRNDSHKSESKEAINETDERESNPSQFNSIRRTVRSRTHHRRPRHHGHQHHGHHHHHAHGYLNYHLTPFIALSVNHNENDFPPPLVPPLPADGTSSKHHHAIHPEEIEGLDAGTIHSNSVKEYSTFRLFAERGFRHKNVDRLGFGLLLVSPSGLGIQTDWHFYTESLPGGIEDQLRVGDFNVVLQLGSNDFIRGRFGLGLAWLNDAIETNFGPNFSVGADLFPQQPIGLTFEFNWGTIGDADVFHTRFAATATWKHVELFAGFDYRKFGSISLYGPMAGGGIRF